MVECNTGCETSITTKRFLRRNAKTRSSGALLPLHNIHWDPVGIEYAEVPLAPGLVAQRYFDRHAERAQMTILSVDVLE